MGIDKAARRAKPLSSIRRVVCTKAARGITLTAFAQNLHLNRHGEVKRRQSRQRKRSNAPSVYAKSSSHSPTQITTRKHPMGCPNKDGRNVLRKTMNSLAPVEATARGRHWCSQEARPKAWVRGHVQVSGDVRAKRRSRSGGCSFRNLGPQVPAEGRFLWPRDTYLSYNSAVETSSHGHTEGQQLFLQPFPITRANVAPISAGETTT